jgi:hypothetical protein
MRNALLFAIVFMGCMEVSDLGHVKSIESLEIGEDCLSYKPFKDKPSYTLSENLIAGDVAFYVIHSKNPEYAYLRLRFFEDGMPFKDVEKKPLFVFDSMRVRIPVEIEKANEIGVMMQPEEIAFWSSQGMKEIELQGKRFLFTDMESEKIRLLFECLNMKQ